MFLIMCVEAAVMEPLRAAEPEMFSSASGLLNHP